MVFYLKYRPQTLDELDTQDISAHIKRYLSRESFPHAFLFTGPKGTGKTSTARIVAKSINCTSNKSTRSACGTCAVCVSIAKGASLDILEIDGASNRGIDEIRDLREKIKLAPSSLTYKVYIVDEVHMLTTEAFNALLKTLEEPPAHAVFILATTESHKVPDTIKSRCVQVDFRKATVSDLMHSLERITKGEKLVIDKKVLESIAQAADGSFRDAAKFLEEVVTADTKLSPDAVQKLLGRADGVLIDTCLKNLEAKDTTKLLQLIQELGESGIDVKSFFTAVLQKLESLLIKIHTEHLASDWKVNDVTDAIEYLSHAFSELKSAVIDSLPFEIAVIKYSQKETLKSSMMSNEQKSVQPTARPISTGGAGIFAEKWDEILARLKPHNHSIAGVMRSCKAVAYTDSVLTIEAAYKFHADRLNDPKIRELLTNVLTEISGMNVKLNIVIKNRN